MSYVYIYIYIYIYIYGAPILIYIYGAPTAHVEALPLVRRLSKDSTRSPNTKLNNPKNGGPWIALLCSATDVGRITSY